MNFTLPKQIILLYVLFESRSFWAVPHDSEAGVWGLLHDLGKSPDGYMDALPVEQAAGVEKSRRP